MRTSGEPIYCWGAGYLGQMGNGTSTSTNRRATAVDVSGALADVTVVDLSMGAQRVIALGADGYVYGWGSGANGALGRLGNYYWPRPKLLRTSPQLDAARVTAVGAPAFATWMVTEAR